MIGEIFKKIWRHKKIDLQVKKKQFKNITRSKGINPFEHVYNELGKNLTSATRVATSMESTSFPNMNGR